jgi:hypothetical protein
VVPKARNRRASTHPNISYVLTSYARARLEQHVSGSRRPQMAPTSDSIPMSMRVSGEPAEILAAVGRCLERMGGQLQKTSFFSTTRCIEHPDGLVVNVKAKLFVDDKGLVLEVQRRSGDAVLFSVVYTYVAKFMRNWLKGFPDLIDQPFHLGQIMPCPAPRPAPPPCDVPPLALDASAFVTWGLDELQSFGVDHADVTQAVRKGGLDNKAFRAHVARVPRAIIEEYKLSVRMPATLTACEKIDDLIAEGLALLSANG